MCERFALSQLSPHRNVTNLETTHDFIRTETQMSFWWNFHQWLAASEVVILTTSGASRQWWKLQQNGDISVSLIEVVRKGTYGTKTCHLDVLRNTLSHWLIFCNVQTWPPMAQDISGISFRYILYRNPWYIDFVSPKWYIQTSLHPKFKLPHTRFSLSDVMICITFRCIYLCPYINRDIAHCYKTSRSLNIKTVFPMFRDFHVKSKTAARLYRLVRRHLNIETAPSKSFKEVALPGIFHDRLMNSWSKYCKDTY